MPHVSLAAAKKCLRLDEGDHRRGHRVVYDGQRAFRNGECADAYSMARVRL
jgi:hypothetical protein